MSTKRLTFYDTHSAVHVHGDTGFRSNNSTGLTLYTNETLDASESISINAVLLDLQDSNISIGLFPADATEECQNNRVGSAGLPGSVACKIGNGRARILSNGTEWSDAPCDLKRIVLVKVTVTKGIVTFFLDGSEVECPQLAENPLQGELRVGVSTETGQQRGALVEKEGPPGIPDAQACFSGNGGGTSDESDSDAPEVGPLYTNVADLKFEIEQDGPLVALAPTVLRCNAAQDGTAYVAVPIGTEERAAIGVSVRFTGLNKGYAGCGFFKKEALDARDAQQCLLGKTEHSIGCLLKNGEVFFFINDIQVFCGDTPKSDELTMHFSFDRNKGMHVRIEKGVVNCDEFKDLPIFDGDLYFGVSLSGEGQLARVLPSGLGAPRFHYGIIPLDVDEDKLMRCKHSVGASLSTLERWYGDAEKVFVMRITNVCREPIGIGLVSAKLWTNGRQNTVGSTEFGPYSIGLVIKDRRIYIHHQDEFVEWKPLDPMPPVPNSVDLMMRVSGGEVSFFYQGIPVIMPVVSDLTLPADERFRAAYTMSEKEQTAVIPPNVALSAPRDLANRCTFIGDVAHVELSDGLRTARSLFAGALCFISEAFAVTPSPWDVYPHVCCGCKSSASTAVRVCGTLWLCPKCGVPEEFVLCDGCYWNKDVSVWPHHEPNQFIPLLGEGFNEVRLFVVELGGSYIEVGVTPVGYEDGFGSFGQNTSVILGTVRELVQSAMPAGKIVEGRPALKSGDLVWIRVVGAELFVLVNRVVVFQTTLPAGAPFASQGLRFAVRMGTAGQVIRAEKMDLLPVRQEEQVSVTDDEAWLNRELDLLSVPAHERVLPQMQGTLVALDPLHQVATMKSGESLVKAPISCLLHSIRHLSGLDSGPASEVGDIQSEVSSVSSVSRVRPYG